MPWLLAVGAGSGLFLVLSQTASRSCASGALSATTTSTSTRGVPVEVANRRAQGAGGANSHSPPRSPASSSLPSSKPGRSAPRGQDAAP
jgi:hypothetical protein